MGGDLALSVSISKNLIIRAENARIMHNFKEMKKMYTNVMIENQKIIRES